MDRQKIERSIKGLSEWQMHVQAESGIDTNISTAIEALKAQLSQEGATKDATSDMISRQAAIDLFPNDVLEWDTLNGYIAPHVARRLIEQLPPAQPEPHWIPVSERMPEDLEEVNVTWVNRNPESYYESIKDKPFTATAVYYKGKWYWWSAYARDLLAEYGERCSVGLLHEAIEITAWMPLPSPYQKGATP